MTRYIVLTTEEKTPRQRALPPAHSNQKRFQEWVSGDVIRRKSNHYDRLRIVGFDAARMTYGITVQVSDERSGANRSMSSSTLQTAFEHDPVEGVVHATLPRDGTPIAFNVDLIRNFYPRKGGRKGTRIMTCNGVAYAVTEEFDDVLRLVQETSEEDDAEA